ncbi:MAG: hypothetical protein CBC38_07545 [Gammaproteobacteria bacterium TMED78]|nr:MAG: hypothetical protein CBC38_07545 [Gammaproteobacteria bacterium TMED78]|tara:strand:- start:90 stop:719 length:630 start_codon:yes stop_codon:yes gene_type:complete
MIQRNIFIIFIFFFPFSQSFSQGWFTYSDQEWFFSVNFPHEPEIEEIIYPSEWGGFYPGRIYRAELNNQTFSLTVINYNEDETAYDDLLDSLNTDDYFSLSIYDRKGSIAYAARNIRLRAVDVTYDAWGHINFVEGLQLHTVNADDSISHIGIYYHSNQQNVNNNYLYILEGTTPKDYPPSFFYQSIGFLDENGNDIRYDSPGSSVRRR